MRILQLIDSLDAGGAERMAVNYANGLVGQVELSALVSTRTEGVLKDTLNENVNYLFLKRKKIFDFSAVFRLKSFLEKNRITIIHAHSTSLFIAVFVKLISPKLKIIWHDHYGNSEYLDKRPISALRLMSYFIIGSVSVNESLLIWGKQKLKIENIIYLPNFSPVPESEKSITKIEGHIGKRIVCLANLRKQKNHFLLLDAAFRIKKSHPEWTFHLIGKNFQDTYSKSLIHKIKVFALQNHVFIYGSCSDTSAILKQMNIGILTSASEGLPLALLEYGSNNLPCVVTEVGEISNFIINNFNGLIVPNGNSSIFVTQLKRVLDSEQLRNVLAEGLSKTVLGKFSKDVILENYLKWIKSIT